MVDKTPSLDNVLIVSYHSKMSDVTEKSARGAIRPEGNSGETIYSKFRLEGKLKNPVTEVDEIWAFNVNSDVSVVKFFSRGADKVPIQYTLVGSWTKMEQFSGFDRFSGSIGGGRIYIKTTNGIVFKGEIVGGPAEGQSFVGSGTWLKS